MQKFIKPFAPFLKLLTAHAPRMLLGTCLGWLAVSAAIGLLALSGWFISAAAFAGLSLSTAHLFNFFFPSIGVRLFAATRTLTRYGERIINHDVTFRILATVRVWFYGRIEPLAPARLKRYASADILNRIVSDIDALDNLYVRTLSPSVVAVLTTMTVVGLLTFFDIRMAGYTLFFLVVSGLLVPLAAAVSGATLGRRLLLQKAALRIHVVETIQGMAALMLYHAWHRQVEVLKKESQGLLQIQQRLGSLRGLFAAVTILISGVATVVVLGLGIDRIETSGLEGTSLALAVFAVLAAFEALATLPAAYLYMGQTRRAGQRLTEIVQTEPRVTFPPLSHVPLKRYDIRFDHIDFRYPPSVSLVLSAFDLHIRQAQHVAVVGETGAGKSTLVHLLARFWDPSRGCIRIGGRDIRGLSESDLRNTLGIASQNAHLFHTTLRANLQLAYPRADTAAMRSALEKVQLLDWVDSLPRGMDSWLGEGGRTLSGGQARRLILARVLLQDAPIWVLDEPFEGLDTGTRATLAPIVLQAAQGRTLLMITHQTSHLDQFDQIVVLDNGRVRCQGRHAELANTCPGYPAFDRQNERA